MPRRCPSCLLTTLATLAAAPAARGDDAPAASAQVIVVRRCDVEYERSSLVGPALTGSGGATVLQDCLVRRGDRVEPGQVLGRVADAELRAELELRAAQAEADIDIRVCEARLAQAQNKLQRSETLQRRVYVSVEELRAHELEATTARLEVEQAKLRRKMAEIERRRVEALLKGRECAAPHAGMVVEVLRNRGELVGANEPIFRVVDDRTLRVTGQVNLVDYWRVKVGQRVVVRPELDGEELAVEREAFEGRVVFVDSRIDPQTRTARVVTEVSNRDGLLASGLEARMEIFPGPGPPPAARPAAAAPAEPAAGARPEGRPAARAAPREPPAPPPATAPATATAAAGPRRPRRDP
jgi:RND family efflux transporter MFP subunit